MDEQEGKTVFYNELAIASITVGITSFIQLFGLEKSITSIVFGILALRRLRQDQSQRGKKLAIAGVVLGAIYMVLAIIMLPQAIEIAKNIISSTQQ